MKKYIIPAIMLLFFIFAPAQMQAQNTGSVQLTNPIPTLGQKVDRDTIAAFVGTTIQKVLGTFGSLLLVVFLYGGFLWLTSRGDSDQVRQGLDTMLYAGIGVAIIFGSYAVLNMIFTGLSGA